MLSRLLLIPALVVGLLSCGGGSGSGTTSGPTIPEPAPTTGSLPQPREAKGSDLSRTSTLDWANRVTSNDPKVRATAEAALVQGAERSLPLLRGFLNRPNKDLHLATFEIIRRIGPPAIPLLVERRLCHARVIPALVALLSGSSELQVHLTGEFGWGRWRCGEVGEGAEVH